MQVQDICAELKSATHVYGQIHCKAKGKEAMVKVEGANWVKEGTELGLTFLQFWEASMMTQWHFLFCVTTLYIFPKVKERERRNLNTHFPVSVQFPVATRNQRGPSMQLLMSEAYLPHRRYGNNQIDVWTLYQNSHFGPVLLLWGKFCLNVTVFNLFTFLVTCLQQNTQPTSLQSE